MAVTFEHTNMRKILFLIIIVCVGGWFYSQGTESMAMFKSFGKNPFGQRLERISKSPQYRDGIFQNIHPTPMTPDGVSQTQVLKDFFLGKKPDDIKPANPIPSIKHDLSNANQSTPKLTWFGHSSYLIQYKGKNILVDPVFSGNAAPVTFAVKSFDGANTYTEKDMPHIDLIIISHDHYDHLDYKTVSALKDQADKIIMPLGVGSHFESWGFPDQQIHELDWWENFTFSSNIKVTATPARHFSGRLLERSKTLWASYVLELDQYKIFIGGDSGYDDQFVKIGQKFGPIDLAILECGQYGINWPYIHMFPEQTAQAAKDLNAKYLFPVHWGKFILSVHSWNESIQRVSKKAQEIGVHITTPIIGEPIILNQTMPESKWWEKL